MAVVPVGDAEAVKARVASQNRLHALLVGGEGRAVDGTICRHDRCAPCPERLLERRQERLAQAAVRHFRVAGIARADRFAEEGADYVEMDVRMTSDGKLVLMHDPSTERTTGVDKLVCDTTYEELQQLDAGAEFSDEYAGTKIPTLQAALRRSFCSRTSFPSGPSRPRSITSENRSTSSVRSRNYAKRQLTWFRHMEGICWLDASAPDVREQAARLTNEFLAKG